jgi:hypothetical protein
MPTKRHIDISRLFREGTPIDRALAAAAREAVRKHKQAGLPLAVWRDGKAVWVMPDDLEREAKLRRSR